MNAEVSPCSAWLGYAGTCETDLSVSVAAATRYSVLCGEFCSLRLYLQVLQVDRALQRGVVHQGSS